MSIRLTVGSKLARPGSPKILIEPSPGLPAIFDTYQLLQPGLPSGHLENLEIMVTVKVMQIQGRSDRARKVDEAQNLTPHEVKTIVSRAGTKVVLTGDPYQIDNPYLDSNSNGLTYPVEHFKSQTLLGHITLTKSERSPLAALAADLL